MTCIICMFESDACRCMHQEFWTSCWIAWHCGLAGSEKWALISPYWITSSGLASSVSREELPFEPNYKCRNKESKAP